MLLLYNKWLEKSSAYEIPVYNNHNSIKLNIGELNFPVHPTIASILQSCYTDTNCCRYNTKDDAYLDLIKKISDYVHVPETHILLTHGSDNALRILCDVFCTENSIFMIPYPSYPHFEQMLSTHRIKELRKVPICYSDTDQQISEIIQSELKDDVSVVYIVRPDLSIGFNVPVHDIETMVKRSPQTLFIIDEAYIEFADQVESCTVLTKKYHNIIVVRTFSKFFSIAALRIGYMVASPSLIQLASPLNNIKDVSRIAVRSAILSLDHLDFYQQTKKQICSIRNLLRGSLTKLQENGRISGWVMRDNMFFLIFSPHAKTLCSLLEKKHIFVRDKSDVIPDAIRVTLSNLTEMNLFLSALEDCSDGFSNHKTEKIHD